MKNKNLRFVWVEKPTEKTQIFIKTRSTIKEQTAKIIPLHKPPQSNNKKYGWVEELKQILVQQLQGKKFVLDCGHRVTFGHNLWNNVIIYNGKDFEIICTDCGY